MGMVWRGQDRETGAVYAVKVLRSELARDPAVVTRFVRERTALVKFRHPNVVTLHDMIVEGDRLALVMDLVEGGDLDTYWHYRGGILPQSEALELTAQICDALAAAHAAGIVHRDLKPANVLLDAGQVRLADFGIARIAGEPSATTTGTVIGTVGFMAPEVIRGEEPTAAADVYAVGITLYQLLAGVLPFTGQAAAVMHGHLEAAAPRPAGMPDRLWALISACLRKEAPARPAAATLARALCDPALIRESASASETVPPLDLAYLPGLDPATESARLPAAAADGRSTGEAGPSGSAGRTGSRRTGSHRPEGRRTDSRRPGSRRIQARTAWVAAVALALVFAAAGAVFTRLTTSGSTHHPSAPAAAAGRGRTAALAKAASQAPSHPAATPTGRSAPSAHASTSAAPSGAPASNPIPAGTPAVLTASGPNLVADGYFGQPTLSAWNHQVWNTILVNEGMNGGNAAQMTANPTAGLSQIVTGLQPGTHYQLTGWISSDGGPTYVGVKAYDSTSGVSIERQAAAWTEVSMTFTPAPGYTTAEVFCWRAVAGTGLCTDLSLRAMR